MALEKYSPNDRSLKAEIDWQWNEKGDYALLVLHFLSPEPEPDIFEIILMEINIITIKKKDRREISVKELALWSNRKQRTEYSYFVMGAPSKDREEDSELKYGLDEVARDVLKLSKISIKRFYKERGMTTRLDITITHKNRLKFVQRELRTLEWFFGYGFYANRKYLESIVGSCYISFPAKLNDHRMCFNVSDTNGASAFPNAEHKKGCCSYGRLYFLNSMQMKLLDKELSAYYHLSYCSVFLEDGAIVHGVSHYHGENDFVNNYLRPTQKTINAVIACDDILPKREITRIKRFKTKED